MPKRKHARGEAAAFIRSQPWDLPAHEVVKRGAEKGLSIAISSVYGARKKLRDARGEEPKQAPKAKPNGGKYTPDEVALMRLAIGIGIPRAAHLLDVAHQATLSAVDRLGEQ